MAGLWWRRAMGRWLGLAAALVLLNLALTFHNVWPTPWVTTRHELSVELALLVLGLGLHWRLAGAPSPRLIRVLTLGLCVLAAGRYADVTAPALYGRPLNLYWDGRHFPAVLTMLGRSLPGWQLAAALGALLLLLASLYTVLRWALGRLASGLQRSPERRVMVAAGALLSSLYCAGLASPRVATEHWFSLPVTPLYLRQASFVVDAMLERATSASLPPSPSVRSDLAAVAGADVVVMFLESYGATSYDNPTFAAALRQRRHELAQAISDSGRRVASARVRSPTFGGASWLAHASFMTGIEVSDPASYALLLTQPRPTLVQRFVRQGYRAIAVMPGLRQRWPEGAFYGFDRLYDAAGIGYPGPDFGFWRIPDQYALARLYQAELAAPGDVPRFVFFPTISSHLPFRPTPPYQPDWQRLLSAQPFDAAAYREAMAVAPELTDLGPAYLGALDYDFRVLAGAMREHAAADQVLIVLGDHQPAASVSGEGASWDVPVHVISNRKLIIDRLLAVGFDEGLEPRRATLGLMHELHGLLLRAFDSGNLLGAQGLPAAAGAASTRGRQQRVDVP